MIKKTKLAFAIAATLGVSALAIAPQASADEFSHLKSRIAKLERAAAADAVNSDSGNMVFFRFGYAGMSTSRKGEILTDTVGGLTGFTGVSQANGDTDGAYFGAGFDFSLSDDAFGFHDGTEILAELMFEYKEFQRTNLALQPLITTVDLAATGGLGTPSALATAGQVTVSQFTLSAAPKIKFMKGSKFRPWVIPMGFSMHVISPPSNGVTVLKPSMMFAFGAEYTLWKSISLGADFRYHVAVGKTNLDGTDTDGLTTGIYLGIGF